MIYKITKLEPKQANDQKSFNFEFVNNYHPLPFRTSIVVTGIYDDLYISINCFTTDGEQLEIVEYYDVVVTFDDGYKSQQTIYQIIEENYGRFFLLSDHGIENGKQIEIL